MKLTNEQIKSIEGLTKLKFEDKHKLEIGNIYKFSSVETKLFIFPDSIELVKIGNGIPIPIKWLKPLADILGIKVEGRCNG